jgi:hypothetical protein
MKQAFLIDSEPQHSPRPLRLGNYKKPHGIRFVAVLRIKGTAAACDSPRGGGKNEVNPMNQTYETNIRNLPGVVRCGAKTRAGTPCQCLAMKDRKRCRIHGGLSPGAPRGTANGNYRDGYWTREAVEERKFIRSLVKGTLVEKS